MARRKKVPPVELTDRQREIFTLLIDGMTDYEVADKLDLSRPTVRKHVQNALETNGCPSRLVMAVRMEREAAAERLAAHLANAERDLLPEQINRMSAYAQWHLGDPSWGQTFAEAATDPEVLQNLADEGCELASDMIENPEEFEEGYEL